MIKKFLNRLLFVFLLTLVCLTLFLIWVFKSDFLNLNIKNQSEVFLVENGDNLRKISEKLEVYDIYDKPFFAFIIMKLMIGNSSIYVGEYEVFKEEKIIDLVRKIKNKVHYYRKITFVEGETIFTYKEQINNSFGLMGEITKNVKEGYFMPGTYNYLYGETKDSMLKRGEDEMIKFLNLEFSKIENKDEFYLKNIHEVLTLASVVEKESAIGVERRLIAGVFYNRLKQKMKLQSDPTTVYEITKGKYKLDRPLTYDDLKMQGEYNTYYIKALPIAPIASPGMESIIAVLNPEKTNSLYFVADGNGGHNFSESFTGHRENIKKYKQTLKSYEER